MAIRLVDISIDLVFSELKARFDLVDQVFNAFKDEIRWDIDCDVAFMDLFVDGCVASS